MPFLLFSLLNLSWASCPAVLDQVAVTVSPAATTLAQEMLGLDLLSAADRLRLSARLDDSKLTVGLKGGRALFSIALDDEGRADLNDGIGLIVRSAGTFEIVLEVPASEMNRFRRRSAPLVRDSAADFVEVPVLLTR